jgi:DNA-binding transcriptional regulator LsrR (DeoR family)
MANPRRTTKDLNAQIAAFLRGEHRLKQGEIARLLDVSQSLVSRLLKRADQRGWLKVEYRFQSTGLTADRLAYLRRFLEPKGLMESLKGVHSRTGVRVRELRVVNSGGRGTSRRVLDSRIRHFGLQAAGRVGELIRQSDVFGVTWGTTVSHVVEGIATGPLPQAGRSTRFVPVCAEPLDQASNKDTSSHLVRQLHDLFQPDTPLPPSLTGVPALIPRSFRGTDARGIRKFVEHAASYREVFGSRSPLIEKVDSLLTSVGPSRRPMGFMYEELLRAGSTPSKKLTAAALTALVAGDIGGVLLPRRDLTAAERREVHRLNAMSTGVTLTHLERIARDADSTRRPGVIVVSLGGADRAEIIAEAVRWGLINELIVDQQLVEALTRVLSNQPSEPSASQPPDS